MKISKLMSLPILPDIMDWVVIQIGLYHYGAMSSQKEN